MRKWEEHARSTPQSNPGFPYVCWKVNPLIQGMLISASFTNRFDPHRLWSSIQACLKYRLSHVIHWCSIIVPQSPLLKLISAVYIYIHIIMNMDIYIYIYFSTWHNVAWAAAKHSFSETQLLCVVWSCTVPVVLHNHTTSTFDKNAFHCDGLLYWDIYNIYIYIYIMW